MLGDIGPFFLKIDVEGHEMKVLEGFRGNIGRHRPKIFIEVSPHNADVFAAWVREHGYRISQRFRRYETVENFMLVPES